MRLKPLFIQRKRTLFKCVLAILILVFPTGVVRAQHLKLVHSIRVSVEGETFLSFSPDGKILACGGHDGASITIGDNEREEVRRANHLVLSVHDWRRGDESLHKEHLTVAMGERKQRQQELFLAADMSRDRPDIRCFRSSTNDWRKPSLMTGWARNAR